MALGNNTQRSYSIIPCFIFVEVSAVFRCQAYTEGSSALQELSHFLAILFVRKNAFLLGNMNIHLHTQCHQYPLKTVLHELARS